MIKRPLPHILILSWLDDDYSDREEFGYWNTSEITCPYSPATAHMPCATWEPCGCESGAVGEMDDWDDLIYEPWPCSASPIGEHRYIDDEPHRPTADCFTNNCDVDIYEIAEAFELPAGTYLVRPWWDEDTIQFDLVDPLVMIR